MMASCKLPRKEETCSFSALIGERCGSARRRRDQLDVANQAASYARCTAAMSIFSMVMTAFSAASAFF